MIKFINMNLDLKPNTIKELKKQSKNQKVSFDHYITELLRDFINKVNKDRLDKELNELYNQRNKSYMYKIFGVATRDLSNKINYLNGRLDQLNE